jgi:uncharacterized protein (TIGR03067 family)
MRTIAGLLLLAAGLMVSAPTILADTTEDHKKLEGKWKVTSASVSGMTMPAKEREKVRVVFSGEKLSILGSPDGDKHTTYKIDPSKKPATIDIAPPPGKQNDALGIYQFDGTALTLCFAEGSARPIDFKDTKNALVLVLEKEKEKDKEKEKGKE